LLLRRGNNEEFLSRTLKYAQRKKWSHLLAAYKTALAKLKLDQPAAAAAPPPQKQQQQQQPEANGVGSPAAAAAGSGGRSSAGSKGKAEGQAAAGEGKARKKRRVTPEAQDTADEADAVAAAAADAQKAAKGPSKLSKSKRGTAGAAAAAAETASSAPGAAAAAAAGLRLSPDLQRDWSRFAADVDAAERASAAAEGGFAFAFVEGALVKALKHGWWLLLDEINLAPPEVLERIAGILESSHPAGSNTAAAAAAADTGVDSSSGLLLVERGDVSVITRHPGFRLVAAMNPATDAGKRDLPPQLRSRFTEFWVGEPRSREDLCQLVGGYLAGAGPSPPVDQVVAFYIDAKANAVSASTQTGGRVHPGLCRHAVCAVLPGPSHTHKCTGAPPSAHPQQAGWHTPPHLSRAADTIYSQLADELCCHVHVFVPLASR
jgi:hypothetical protein